MNLKAPLIVASKSLRRQNLVKALDIDFIVRTLDIEEDYPQDMSKDEVPEYLAIKKNNEYAKYFSDYIILTADTAVILGDSILEKPNNEEEAKRTLLKLSGKHHKVVTGYCVSFKTHTISGSDCTDVEFRRLRALEIDYYIQHYKPYDKAGSYGIQDWLGMIAIERITGSYYNVMGLPVNKIFSCLMNFKA